jgi:hypothetical protein
MGEKTAQGNGARMKAARMKDERHAVRGLLLIHPSAFILHPFPARWAR